jgi:hypothetical protein
LPGLTTVFWLTEQPQTQAAMSVKAIQTARLESFSVVRPRKR